MQVMTGNDSAGEAVNRFHRWFKCWPISLLFLPVAAALGCTQPVPNTSAAEDSPTALAVDTLVVHREESISQEQSFSGLVKARRTTELSFPRGGTIVNLLVSEGDIVDAGQPLCELDQQRLELKKANLQAGLQRARTALAALKPEDPPMTAEERRAALQRLRGELEALEAQTATGSQPPSYVARFNKLESDIAALNESARQREIRAKQQLIEELRGQLRDLDLELEEGRLVAPYEGSIAVRYVDEGAVVSPGLPIVRLVEQGVLRVRVAIPLSLAATIQLGQRVVVDVGARSLPAIVVAKRPQVDQSTRSRTIVFELPDSASEQISPGEVARVRLRAEIPLAGSCCWLPLAALSREAGGLWSVYAVDGEVVSRRYVELLHLESDRALARGTLEDGERVIAHGLHRVVPGQRVAPRDLPAERSTAAEERGASE